MFDLSMPWVRRHAIAVGWFLLGWSVLVTQRIVEGCPMNRVAEISDDGRVVFCETDESCKIPHYACMVNEFETTMCCSVMTIPPELRALIVTKHAAYMEGENVTKPATPQPPAATPATTKPVPPPTAPPTRTDYVTLTAPPTSPQIGRPFTPAVPTQSDRGAMNVQPLFPYTVGPACVYPILTGRLVPTSDPNLYYRTGSVTWICDGGLNIIIDTGMAAHSNAILTALTRMHVYTKNIQLVLNTHGHPDHIGNQNLFQMSQYLYGHSFIRYDQWLRTDLSKQDMIRLTRNINIYKTPGHSVDDITAVVNCVPNYGTVAVVGDLFLHEMDDGVWRQYAWNVSMQMANRQKILCLANWIVPGHGPMFQISTQTKQMYGCMGASSSGHQMARCAPQNPITEFEHYDFKMEKEFIPFSDKQA